MNNGLLVFLGLLATFAGSWWGFIFAPQLQIGSQQPAPTDTGAYPVRRAGIAQQGHEIYVANGCVQCHSQQLRQEGFTFDLVLVAVGTNSEAVGHVLSQIAPNADVKALIAKTSDKTPQTIFENVSQAKALDAQARLKKVGANAQPVFVPLGADIERGWGVRRTVAADYLYDDPVQIGNSRLGPDLSNIGARNPDPNWQLLHLYDPRTVVPGSMMPAYRYLFETRPAGRAPSPNALKLPEKFAPKPGYEIVPTTEALQLVAYLQSLRVDTALFEAPLPMLPAPPAAGTNAPAATNASAAANTPQP
jgi:cbb3-type cytochrome oxidase cytochrome c subunit